MPKAILELSEMPETRNDYMLIKPLRIDMKTLTRPVAVVITINGRTALKHSGKCSGRYIKGCETFT